MKKQAERRNRTPENLMLRILKRLDTSSKWWLDGMGGAPAKSSENCKNEDANAKYVCRHISCVATNV